MLRTGKKWAAAATLSVRWRQRRAGGAGRAPCPSRRARKIFAALAAVLGHIFPLWLRFKGGKGVATYLGVTIALYWPVGLLVAATWLVVALVWRVSSLSALVAIVLSPVYFFVFGQRDYVSLAVLLAALVIFMHRENIRRLLRGEEPRIGSRKSGAGGADA